ncbi:MAG TPA: S41 family peptidase [Thermoanaerobaculia bacterium]|nr:S41 family peptidase [Thermoanaerobaculia bacterium]
MKRSWRITAVVLFTLALALGGMLGDRVLALTDEARDNLRLYTELINAAHDHYGVKVAYKDLVYSSIQGMLRTLDPHTSFLPPEAYSGMREKQQSSFYGLGILVGIRNGQLTVVSPLEGTPASRLGIQAGDVISTIEGEPTETMTLDEAVLKLKGPKGTQVKISIVRRGLDQPLTMSVTRAEIPQTTVRMAYMLTPAAPDTGYIQLSEFSRGTGREMAEAIDKLKGQGMKRLLIDLRNNGGGLLDQAIEVADQFLPAGSMIVQTKGRTRDSVQEYKADGKYPDLDLPVVVLVNEGTASAAEILSGALQDHDMGLVVGTPSWGKGLVQTVYNLSYGSGLALTTAKYYTPSGRLIQRDYTSYFDYYTHANAGPPKAGTANVQVFQTDLGRKVYGGGGITPDVNVEDDELSPFEQFLLARNAFVNFAVEYKARNPVKSPDWKPGPTALDEFKAFLVKEKTATAAETDEAFAKPEVRGYALMEIRAEVLNTAFGQEARSRVITGGDKQITAALGLFDRAAQMLAQRRELREDKRAAARAAK